MTARKLTPRSAPAVVRSSPGTMAAEVPDERNYTSYMSRNIHGAKDLDILAHAHAWHLNALLEGPTGAGKTSVALAYAAQHKLLFYSVSSNVGVEPSQLFGRWVNIEGKWTLIDGAVTSLIRTGGVLLINEVGFMPERVSTVLFSLMDKRRSITLMDHGNENVRAHTPPMLDNTEPCWCSDGAKCPPNRALLILADNNPGYSGTRELNYAFRNRFPIQIHWDYDKAIEQKLVKSSALLLLAEGLRTDTSVDTPTSTNMLFEFEQIVGMFGLDFAIENFAQHYLPDEQAAVRAAFGSRRDALVAELLPPVPPPPPELVDDGFGNVFHATQAQWMLPVPAAAAA